MEEETMERPIRAMRRRMLEKLLEVYGGPKRLAEVTGTVDTHLIAIQKGRRGIGDELATKLEAGTGKPFGWMDGALSEEALEIALQLDSITDPETREVAVARAYTAAYRLQKPAAPSPDAQVTPAPTKAHQER